MIDSHQHFWDFDPERHAWITDDMKAIRRHFQPSDLRPLLEHNGFEGCVAVQVDQTEEETHYLLRLSRDNDFIKGVVGWVDLRSDDLASRLEDFSSFSRLKGFRHIVQAEKPGFLSAESFIRGVNSLAGHGFTYDLLLYHHQLEEAVAFLDQITDTRIVIDHIAKPAIARGEIRGWEEQMRRVALKENVFCKVSGMVTEAKWPGWKYEDFVPYLDVVVEAFGTDRLMYGSDWPVCLVAASYEEQLSITQKYFSSFSPAEKQKILGENAKRFYNL